MHVLLMNTCGADGMIALADGTGVLAEERLPPRGTSEHLMPAVRRLLEGAGLRVRGLSAIAVVVGPGSFTGVRVGLSAAKGLCEAGGVPMIGISRLALLAAAASQSAGETLALLDGARGEYYCGVYRGAVCLSEKLATMDEVQGLMGGRLAVACEPRVANAFGGPVQVVPEPGGAEMHATALRRIGAGEWSDVAATDANYLRRTDAELKAAAK